MLGLDNQQDPNGEYQYIFESALCLSLRIYVKLDYNLSLLSQTACQGKIFGPRYSYPKRTKAAIFSIFYVFSFYRSKYLLQKKISAHFILDLIKPHLFKFSEFRCDNFPLNYYEKPAKIVKSAYNLRLYLMKLEIIISHTAHRFFTKLFGQAGKKLRSLKNGFSIFSYKYGLVRPFEMVL